MITSFFSPPFSLNGDWLKRWFPGYYGSAFGPRPHGGIDTWRVRCTRQARAMPSEVLSTCCAYINRLKGGRISEHATQTVLALVPKRTERHSVST